MTCKLFKVFSLFLLFQIFIQQPIIKAQDLNFTASVNPSTLYEGELFELSFSVNTNQWGDFFMPEMEGFQRISGPARSSQTSVVNGQVSHTTTLSWRFRTTTSGEFTIDQGILELNGATLYSNPVEILVIPRGADVPAAERNVLLKVELSCDSCYVGQQITADLFLYTTKAITDYSILAAPDFDGFRAMRLANLRHFNTTRDTLEGRIYNKHLLRRFILFPQMIGTIPIGDFDLRVIEQDRDRRWGGLLSVGGEVHYLSATVPPITVVAAPDFAPEGFAGLVGNFQIAGRYSPSELRVGELTSMTVIVRGDGDPTQMRVPPIELSDGLSIADIQFVNEQIDEVRGKFRFSREWSVLLRSDTPGRASAFPHLLAYDLEADSFYHVSGDTLWVNILPAEEGGMISSWERSSSSSNGGDHFFYSPWFKYGLPAGAIILGIVFFVGFRLRKTKVTGKNEFDLFREDLIDIRKKKFKDQKSHYTAVLHSLEIFIVNITGLPMSQWNEAVLKSSLTEKLPENESKELLKIRQALINSAYGYYPYDGDELESLLLELIKKMEG